MSQNDYHRDISLNNLQIREELVLRETWTPQQTLSALDILKQSSSQIYNFYLHFLVLRRPDIPSAQIMYVHLHA